MLNRGHATNGRDTTLCSYTVPVTAEWETLDSGHAEQYVPPSGNGELEFPQKNLEKLQSKHFGFSHNFIASAILT